MASLVEKLSHATPIQTVAIGAKEIAKDPNAMRATLMGVVSLINFTALFVKIGDAGAAIVSTFKTSQKSIRLLLIGNTLEKWTYYKYKDPLTTLTDVADTIVTVAAIPQFFDSIKVINLTHFSHWFRAIPVIGVVALFPISGIINALEIFTNIVDILHEAKDLHDLKSGKFKAHAEDKIKKYRTAQEEIKEGSDPKAKIPKKYEKLVQGLSPDEIKITTQADLHKRIEKWESKVKNIDLRKKQRIINIAFKVATCVLITFLTAATYAASPMLPVAIAITGLCVTVTGMSRFFHGKFRPMHESVKFQVIRLQPNPISQ